MHAVAPFFCRHSPPPFCLESQRSAAEGQRISRGSLYLCIREKRVCVHTTRESNAFSGNRKADFYPAIGFATSMVGATSSTLGLSQPARVNIVLGSIPGVIGARCYIYQGGIQFWVMHSYRVTFLGITLDHSSFFLCAVGDGRG